MFTNRNSEVYRMKQKSGFTLIELMVVIVIIGILVSLGTFAFLSSQKKSRDARRKSDLDSVARALEMYNTDIGSYPAGGTGVDEGTIIGCGDTTKITCAWGTSFANTTKAINYMIKLPIEPTEGRRYYYERVGTNGYRLYARLDNLEDASIPTTGTKEYGKNCGSSSSSVNCNYVITSSNVVVPTPMP